MAIIDPSQKFISNSAIKIGGNLFDKIINSPNSAIFLAIENQKAIGIVTIHKIPQIRKGTYCGEIEEMFVIPEYQGKGTALHLLNTCINWAKQQNINIIRLESSNDLQRAHGFYEKSGFRFYGRAYELKFE